MEHDADLRTYIDIIRRRFWHFVIPAMLITAGALVVASMLPRVYEASAKVLVESPRIPSGLASPTVTANATERIQVIQQRLMSRENLLRIADKFTLFENEHLSPTAIVERMREATEIGQLDIDTPVFDGGGGAVGFTVSFSHGDPEIAANVANEFVAAILSQNLQSRLSRASETSRFFLQRLAELEKKLADMEEKIAEFKRQNSHDLPETLTFRRQQLEKLTDQIAEVNRRISAAKLPPALAAELGMGGEELLDYQLRAKEIELEHMREQREDLAPLAEKGFLPRNRIRELERTIATRELDIEALKVQIASRIGGTSLDELRARSTELEKRAAEINESILRTPEIEVRLSALNRDYENLQGEYRQAQNKLADAATGERLEEDQKAERFEVIEPAIVPTAPISPRKTRIVMAGSFAGAAFAAGAVVLLELLDKSIRTAADLERRLQLRPIASIPYVTTPGQTRSKRVRLVLSLPLAAALALTALFLLHTYVLPLEALLAEISGRLGF